MILNSSDEMMEQGLHLVPEETLLDSKDFARIEKRLLKIVSETPELSSRPPRPYQLRYAALGVLRRSNLFAHEAGTGKCVAKDTPILMFDGTIKRVQDVIVGDQLMGPDSKPRNVLSLARGREMMYKVTPTKGEPYTVNESHILSLQISNRAATNRLQGWEGYNKRQASSISYKHGDICNISVRDYIKQHKTFKKNAKGYRVGVDFDKKFVPLDPYILGLWLGDGTTGFPWVTTMEKEIVEALDTYCIAVGLELKKEKNQDGLAANYYLTNKQGGGPFNSNPFTKALRDLGVYQDKRIPLQYLANDRDTRMKVLAGIIDTDGYMYNNCYEIACSKEDLAEDITYLARSLGYAAYKSSRTKRCYSPGYEKDCPTNIIHISGDMSELPVRLLYKKCTTRKQKKSVLVTSITVTKLEEDDYYGFTIDGDHLFLLGDFTVTHNTYEACLMIHALYGDTLHKAGPGTIHILAPKHTLRLVWLNKELAKTGLAEFAEVIDSERSARLSKKPIWIYHYDLLKRENKETKKPLYKVFKKRFAPSFLIIDECHRLRAHSMRSVAVRELRKKAKRVLGLTGTPMDGWVEHLSSILAVIYRPKSIEFPYTIGSFTRRFTRVNLQARDYVSGEENAKSVKRRPAPGVAKEQLPGFYQATKHLIHRLTFKDQEVSPHVHFPKTDNKIIECVFDEAHKDFYREVHSKVLTAIHSAIEELDTGTASRLKVRQNILTHLNALRAATNHPWDINVGTTFTRTNTVKVDKVVELCKFYKEQNRKVIVFTNRVAVGRVLTSALKASGLNVIRIYDQDTQTSPKKLSQADRDLRIEQFQEDQNINVLVGNLDLMSEGLTLVEASVVIHHDHDWKSISWSQGNNRVVRPGQEYDPVPVYDLVVNSSIDKYIYQAMRRKAQATMQTIDKNFDTVETAIIDPIDVARSLLNNEKSL